MHNFSLKGDHTNLSKY